MSSSTSATINGYFQSIQFRDAPAATLSSYVALVGSGAMTLEQVRTAIIDDPYTTNNVDPVIRLYQAAFGRVPEAASSIDFYADRLADGRMTPVTIAQSFAASPEFQLRYGTDTAPNAATITALYLNVLGRAPEAAGLQFYLNSGMSTAQMLQAFSQSPEFQARSNAAVEALLNANALGTAVFTGPLQIVTAGQTFTLTTGADTMPGLTGSVGGTSTAGNDTINAAVVGANAAGTTLTAGDNLNAGSGSDALAINISGASGAASTVAGITLASVERVTVSNFDTDTDQTRTHTIDMSGASGVTAVGLTSSSDNGDTVFTGLSGIVSAEMANGGADLTVNYQAAAVAGTADTQSLTVNGVTKAATFTADAGIETLAITGTGAASTLAAVTAAGATRMTVAGDKGVSILGELATTIKTIDASANSGGVSVVLGTANLTVTGGSGADTVRIAGNTVDAADSINAGEGSDTLQLTTAVATSAAGARLAGFENLRSYFDVNATTAIAQDVSLIGGITSVGVTKMTYTDTDNGAAVNATVTAEFTGMSAAQTISISGITSAGDANDNGAMTAALSFALATDTASDKGSITLGTSTAAAAVAGANNAITLNVTANDYEALTVANQGGAVTVATLSATDATSLVINASKGLTITTLTAGSVNTVDAAASTANVKIGNALSVASTIVGGTGNDDFTGSSKADNISGGAGNDTLVGGDGNDIIAGGDGDDSLTGGDGNDVVTGGAGNDILNDVAAGTADSFDGGEGDDTFTIAALGSLASTDTVSGGAGNDTIVFGGDANQNLTADLTAMTNVTGIEVIAFNALSGGKTVTINDGTVSQAGGSLRLAFLTGTTGANTVDASGVFVSTSSVRFDDLAGLATTYNASNARDTANMGDGNDIVVLANSAFLSANDVLAGGAGSDTLRFAQAANSTITTAQLTGVTGFETFEVKTGGAGNYALTLTDAVVGAQVATGATFTVSRNAGDTDTATLKVDGSAVTSSYNLTLTGQSDATAAQTLVGGGGDDVITGGAANDSLTGGAGNDDFVAFNDGTTNGVDTITDFNFGTSTTTVDQLKIVGSWKADFDVVATDATAFDADQDVLIISSRSFATLADVDTFFEARSTENSGLGADKIIIWQDSLGGLQVARAIGGNGANAGADNGDEYTVTNLFTLSGLTVVGVASLINTGDFISA